MVLQASIAPPREKVGAQLEKVVGGVHPHWKDIHAVLKEDPVLLPRVGLEVAHLGAQDDPVATRRHLAHRQEGLRDRSHHRGPDLQGLVAHQPGLGPQGALVLDHVAVGQAEATVADGPFELRALTYNLSRQSGGAGSRVHHEVHSGPAILDLRSRRAPTEDRQVPRASMGSPDLLGLLSLFSLAQRRSPPAVGRSGHAGKAV